MSTLATCNLTVRGGNYVSNLRRLSGLTLGEGAVRVAGRIGQFGRGGQQRDGRGSYAGVDRRARAAVVPPSPREFFLAGLLLLVLAVPFGLIGGRGPLPESFDARALNASLLAMTALLAVVVGSVAVMRWRITGESTSLRVGLAVLMFAFAFAVQLCALVAPGLDEHGGPLVLSAAARAAAIVGLLVAFVASEVDTTLTGRRVTLVTVAVLVVAELVLLAVPTLSASVGATQSLNTATGGPTPVRIASVFGLAVLATLYTFRGLTRQRWLHTWIGLMLFSLALGEGLRIFATSAGDASLTGAAILALCGFAFALNGSARELAAAYSDQRAQLFDSEVRAQTMKSLRRAEQSLREEQHHDARSALFSVQAALRALERHPEVAAGSDGLAQALDAELTRVRDLLAADPAAAISRRFCLEEAINPVTVCHGAAGADVRTEIARGLEAYGQPAVVSEIVDNLVTNAQRHAPGSPIWVTAESVGGIPRVRVDDAGAGVAEADAERIFERGTLGPTGGSGLGLFVARRLARDQGGDLWLEPSRQGGASFVLALASAEHAMGDGATSSDLTMPEKGELGRLVGNGWRAGEDGMPRSGVRHRGRRRG
jgi:signal transduction histidine kinase